MFSFLNPIILIGLAAAAIPLLIHFLTRQKAKTVNFSTLSFLKELQQHTIKRLKLRQILLLIIRTLIILLLVFAFARPTSRNAVFGGAAKGTAATSIAIIFDNSASLGREFEGENLFEHARRRAQEICTSFSAGDEAFLITAATPSRTVTSAAIRNKDRLIHLIDTIELSNASTDIGGGIKIANQVLTSSINLNKEIYIISDMQDNAFSSFMTDSTIRNEYKTFLIPTEETVFENLCIEDVEIENQIIEKGKRVQIKIVVRNSGASVQRNRLVQLFVEGKRAAQSSVTLEPKEAKSVSLSFIPSVSGQLSCRVVVEDNGLHYDDERFFILHIPEKINILIVSNGDEYKIINLALAPGSIAETYFEIQSVQTAKLGLQSLQQFDVIVLCNIERLDLSSVKRIRTFLEDGGGLIFFPGDALDLRSFNTTISPELGLAPFLEFIGASGRAQAYFRFDQIDFEHPLFSGMFEEGKQLITSPKFYSALTTQIKSINSETIIQFSTDSPFLYETKMGAGRIFVFTSGIDESWSTFAVSTIFAPLLSRSGLYLASIKTQPSKSYFVGQTIQARIEAPVLGTQLSIITPFDERHALLPKELGGDYIVEFEETLYPGAYKILSEDREIDRYEVNIDPAESEMAPISQDDLKDIFQFPVYINPKEQIVQQVQETRIGKEFWKPFIIIVLVLVVVEMLLFRERGEVVNSNKSVKTK